MTRMTRRFSTRCCVLALSGVGFLAVNAGVQAAWPERPIRLIVPFPPGGGTDANARALAKEVESVLGQPLVIDNRGGANGIIGADLLARANPDGYTLLHTSVAFAINPSTRKKLPFDVNRDFTPITNVVVGQGSLLTVNPALPAKTVPELIALAKQKQLVLSSPGIGNVLHLIAEAFSVRAGIQMQHVPYKGSGPALIAVLGGEAQVMVVPPVIATPHIQAGRLRALGYSGKQRVAALPEVPTISEAGLKGFHQDTGWHAWFAPANAPGPVVNRIYDAINKSLRLPKLREFFLASGYEPTGDAPAVFQKNFKDDVIRWGEIVKAAKIKPE